MIVVVIVPVSCHRNNWLSNFNEAKTKENVSLLKADSYLQINSLDKSNSIISLIPSYIYTPLFNSNDLIAKNISLYRGNNLIGIKINKKSNYYISCNFISSSNTGFKVGLYKNLTSNLLTGSNSVLTNTQKTFEPNN